MRPGQRGLQADAVRLPGDTILTLEIFDAHPQYVDPNVYLSANLDRATPWAAHLAGVAAGLLGLLGGWLVFGWASRRTEGRPVMRVFAAIPYGLAMFLRAVPTLFALPLAIRYHVTEHRHPRWHPMWEWLGQTTFMPVLLVGCGCAGLALAVAALSRRGASRAARRDAPA